MAEYISKKEVLDYLNGYLHSLGYDNTDLIVNGQRHALINVLEDILTVKAADVQPVNRWISVKDRMPDTPEEGLNVMYSDCCLVCDEFGWCGMAYYITDGQKSWWEFADAQNKNKIDWTEVSHWQPLPEPPKDGERE